MEIYLCLIALVVLVYTVFAKKISTTIVAAPMICLAFGYVLSKTPMQEYIKSADFLDVLATLALILVLFSDASKTNMKALLQNHAIPLRMLFIGLPVMILIGFAINGMIYSQWPVFAMLLVAAILSPTDAALGQAVVTNTNVPEADRRTLTVESGLNDGLALPFVLLFSSYLAAEQGEMHDPFFVFIVKQILIGSLVGVAMGYGGAKVISWASENELTETVYEGIASIALAVSAYLVAELLQGNGFIAVFVAGLVFGSCVQRSLRSVTDFVDEDGQMLVWATFFLIGFSLLSEAIAHLTVPMVLMILLSLFIARPLAIYISLLGTQTTPVNRMFLGWFGPRGLGTALYALLVVGSIDHDYADSVLTIAVNAVWISALLHGMSAAPLSKWYGRYEQSIKR